MGTKGKFRPAKAPISLPQNPAALMTKSAFKMPSLVEMSHEPFSLRSSLVTSAFWNRLAPCFLAPLAMAWVRE